MSKEKLEKEIVDLGLTAPRVTLELVEATVVGETFTILPSGKVMVCELTLLNGFTVHGEAFVVSKENFNEEIGKKVSRAKATDKVWELEGYRLQEKLFNRKLGLLGAEDV